MKSLSIGDEIKVLFKGQNHVAKITRIGPLSVGWAMATVKVLGQVGYVPLRSSELE